MPKPTFLQAVLKKPTRSYADPYHSSPWADQDSQQSSQGSSYYTSSRYDEYDQDGYSHAGPSKYRSGRRGPGSTISNSAMSDLGPIGSSSNSVSMNSRFPKPARRVVSNIHLRDGQLVHDKSSLPKSSSSALGTTTTTRKKKVKSPVDLEEGDHGRPLSRAGTTTTRNGTVKKTKKAKSIINAENDSVLSSPTSTASLAMPPPIHSRNSETSSSERSSPIPPLSPVTATHQYSSSKPETIRHKVIHPPQHKSPLPLLTPPSSEMSTPNSSSQYIQTVKPPTINISTAAREPAGAEPPKIAIKEADSDDDEDVFYTPRSSMVELQLPTPTDIETLATPKQTAPTFAPPSFNFLPPTPAPVPDPSQSPFHSEPSSSRSSSLHPDRPFVPRPSPRIEIPSEINFTSGPETETPKPDDDDDAHSASGQAGSDEEDGESERTGGGLEKSSRQNSGTFERPKSIVWSRPSSVVGRSAPPSVDGYRPPSRHSTSRDVSRNSSDEFPTLRRPSVPASEASYTSAPNHIEGSVRGSISGYGKGGWAAANSTRSRPSSPVMFMPSSGDGWANFQQPPPRQSKFTPLPSASLSPTFDKITDGTRLGGSSTKGSQNGYQNANQHQSRINYDDGLRPPSRGESSPSEYSQQSDGLEMPSRSYVKKDYTSETSHSSALSDGGRGTENERRWNDGPTVPVPAPGSLSFPIARVGSLSLKHSATSPSLARPSSRAGSHATVSRPMSPSMDFSRPTSPAMTHRPPSVMSHASPVTFNPPSFLNPDLLTFLPEMTNEDSDKLYKPTAASESGRGKRGSMQDWNSHNPSRRSSIFKAKSEVGHGGVKDNYEDYENESLPELPARRSKSVMGFRNSEYDREKERERERKWEGSSYGDGVLMESNGRAPDTAGGYTNLVLPSGAYRPINPAKSATGVDSRILGMPHATMASIVLSTTFSRHSSTPAHLRDQLPPLVEFSSQLKPPTKVNDSQLLVQVYAVAIDQNDVRALEEKARWDVGKYVPGRSFVGRALVVGADEKEVVRGDLVIGIIDIRKSGALSEYIVVDRRRISRAPFPTHLTLEQLSLLPLQGISASRAIRTHLIRHSRAIIMNAHTGVAALVCQEMSRSGVNITAVIPGGDDSHENHKACIENGAKGVLMGSPAAVMLNLEESGWDYAFDNVGGTRVLDAARRMLKDGGKLVTTIKPESGNQTSTTLSTSPTMTSRPSGLKSLKAAFGGSSSSSRKSLRGKGDSKKYISIEYLPVTSTGEPEVDSSGMDYRDIMEEPCMAIFKPHLPEYITSRHNSAMYADHSGNGDKNEVRSVVNFEKGHEVFKRDWEGVRVIRVIN